MCLPDPFAFPKVSATFERAAKAGLLVLLAICWSESASASPALMPGRFEMLRERDLRVATVAYRLSTANASLCGRLLTPQLGFVLHSIEQYAPADRAEAARSFALGKNVGIMAVLTGSPAASAGLSAGDQLVSVNGRDLGIRAQGDVPTRVSVDAVQRLLVEEMQRGPITLRVAAEGRTRDVTFAAALGCPANVELVSGSVANAWADGSRVIVSEGLLAKCASDADLALVIGHEMAHNLLHHRRRLAAEGILANSLLPMTGAASQRIRDAEEEADRVGAGLAIAAAYDLGDVEAFMTTLNRGGPVADTHPALGSRLALLRAAIEEARRWRGPRAAFSA